MIKNIVVLGATGSIGGMCLDEITLRYKHNNSLKIVGLACWSNITKLKELASTFNTKYTSCFKGDDINSFFEKIVTNYNPQETAIINALDTSFGYIATKKAVEHNFDTLYIANKESIMLGGKKMIFEAALYGCTIKSIDSEMYALDCLIKKFSKSNISSYFITASGGPFYHTDKKLHDVKVEEAVNHPVWRMGKNISVNSATLANKAYEILEANALFNLTQDMPQVYINKESIIHGGVVLNNNKAFIQYYTPSQNVAIDGVICGKENTSFITEIQNFNTSLENYNILTKDFNTNLSSVKENYKGFLNIAYDCLNKQKSVSDFIKFNEEAVKMFLNKDIAFDEIYTYVNSKLSH